MCFEGYEYVVVDVVEYFVVIGFLVCGDVDEVGVVYVVVIGDGVEYVCKVVQVGGWESQIVIWVIEVCVVGDGGYFDGGFGVVGEGIVEFWIKVICCNLFFGLIEKVLDCVWC